MSRLAACAALTLAGLLSACKSGPSRPGVSQARAVSSAPSSPVVGAQPRVVHGPKSGPIAPFIAAEVTTAEREGGRVLVYVGATWCEPCQRFHRALEAGQLNALLHKVAVVEFDLDESREALAEAGYASRLIPLFAMPRKDGTASEHRLEGSVKGDEAVEQNLVPRLRALLGS